MSASEIGNYLRDLQTAVKSGTSQDVIKTYKRRPSRSGTSTTDIRRTLSMHPYAMGYVVTPPPKVIGVPTPQSIINEPSFVGGAGGVVQGIKALPTVVKVGAGALAGFLGALFFGGGSSQEQQQDLTQQPIITPTQDTSVTPQIKDILDLWQQLVHFQDQQSTVGDISGYVGGSIASPITTTTTITAPYTHTDQSVYTYNYQSTSSYVGATQEQTAEQGTDLMMLALAIGGGYLLSKMI